MMKFLLAFAILFKSIAVMVHGNFQETVSQYYWNQHRTLSLELLFCLYGI